MKIRRLKSFLKDYSRLPVHVRSKVDRQLIKLVDDWNHPSLHTKKLKGTSDIWEVRVDYHNRITFLISKDMLTLRRVGPHDVLNKP